MACCGLAHSHSHAACLPFHCIHLLHLLLRFVKGNWHSPSLWICSQTGRDHSCNLIMSCYQDSRIRIPASQTAGNHLPVRPTNPNPTRRNNGIIRRSFNCIDWDSILQCRTQPASFQRIRRLSCRLTTGNTCHCEREARSNLQNPGMIREIATLRNDGGF